MVECDLAKVEVAGSNPVSRSTFIVGTPVTPTRDGCTHSRRSRSQASLRRSYDMAE